MSLYALRSSRQVRLWFGSLAVLAFGLRAMIPNGFMLEKVNDQLTLVACPAVAPALQITGMQHHMSMPMASDPAGAHTGHEAAAGSCPYALSGGAMLASHALSLAEPWFVFLRPARVPEVLSLPATAPPRHHAPRGPPTLA